MKTYIYFHICQKGEWKRSLNNSISYLKKSGLYDFVDKIRCGILIEKNTIEDLYFIDNKWEILFIYDNCDLYERPTLLRLREDSINSTEEAYALYIHTKGLKYKGHWIETYMLNWIDNMLYWNVQCFPLAFQKLEEGYATFGICPSLELCRHYSGNFWWAKFSYAKTLPATIGNDYLDPEMWVKKGQDEYTNFYGFLTIAERVYSNISPPTPVKKILSVNYGKNIKLDVTNIIIGSVITDSLTQTNFFFSQITNTLFGSDPEPMIVKQSEFKYIDINNEMKSFIVPENHFVYFTIAEKVTIEQIIE